MFQSGCHGNQVSIPMRYEADAHCLKGISIPNMNRKELVTNELLMLQSGFHGNQVSIAMRYEADAYCPKESPYQI